LALANADMDSVKFRLTPDRTPERTAALMEWMVDRAGPGDSPKQYRRVVCGVIGGVGAAVVVALGFVAVPFVAVAEAVPLVDA